MAPELKRVDINVELTKELDENTAANMDPEKNFKLKFSPGFTLSFSLLELNVKL